jgi:hypothetical protein
LIFKFRRRKMIAIEIRGFSEPGSQEIERQIRRAFVGTSFEGIDVKALLDGAADKERYPYPFIELLFSKVHELKKAQEILRDKLPNLQVDIVFDKALEG